MITILHKWEFFTKPEVGTVAVATVRLPFRVFAKTPVRFFFLPASSGARWHELDTVDTAATVSSSSSTLEAMAHIRGLNN